MKRKKKDNFSKRRNSNVLPCEGVIKLIKNEKDIISLIQEDKNVAVLVIPQNDILAVRMFNSFGSTPGMIFHLTLEHSATSLWWVFR